MFDAFVAAGGNYIDTAANYTNGTSEKFVGEFVAGDRDAFVVATKYTLRRPGSQISDLNAGGNARKNMLRRVEVSDVERELARASGGKPFSSSLAFTNRSTAVWLHSPSVISGG